MSLSSHSRRATQVRPLRDAERRVLLEVYEETGLRVRTLVAGANSSACGPRALSFGESSPEGLRGGNP